MQITQTVVIPRSREAVWALFQDVPAVARCMPGAELTSDEGQGRYLGKVTIRVGPLTAAFEGEVEHRPDPESFSGKAEGRGVDRRGGSRSRMAMNYALREQEDGTELTVDAEVQLSGPIAQFGRPAIVTETAKLLIEQFVANVDATLSGEDEALPEGAEQAGSEINALRLGGRVVTGSVKRWLSKA